MPVKIDKHIFLKGRPPLSEFLGVVKGQIELAETELASLTEEWREANHVLSALQNKEAGIADNLMVQKLTPLLQTLTDEVLKNPIFIKAFSIVPPVIGLVELDKLVVFQKHINLSFVEEI